MALSSVKALSALKLSPRRTVQRSLLRNKDLDFLILTGCSCLITLLHHPTLNHLQGNSGSNSAKTPTPTGNPHSSSSPSPNSLGSYSAVAPRRQSFTIEEEEA